MSKNTFTVDGDTITIMRSEWDQRAFASYREDYYKELTSHTWGLKNGYPNNDALGGGLHRLHWSTNFGHGNKNIERKKIDYWAPEAGA